MIATSVLEDKICFKSGAEAFSEGYRKTDSSWLSTAGRAALWTYFGLSRASFLTLPRSFMHEMPDEWQGRMAGLLTQWRETWDFDDLDLQTSVVARGKKGEFTNVPAWLLDYRHPDSFAVNSIRRKT